MELIDLVLNEAKHPANVRKKRANSKVRLRIKGIRS